MCLIRCLYILDCYYLYAGWVLWSHVPIYWVLCVSDVTWVLLFFQNKTWDKTAVGFYMIVLHYHIEAQTNGRHLADDIFQCIVLNENVWIPIKISLKFVPKGRINNIPVLVQIMAWRRPGDKPLSEPMIVSLPTHICVTQPQWVNSLQHLLIENCHLKITL